MSPPARRRPSRCCATRSPPVRPAPSASTWPTARRATSVADALAAVHPRRRRARAVRRLEPRPGQRVGPRVPRRHLGAAQALGLVTLRDGGSAITAGAPARRGPARAAAGPRCRPCCRVEGASARLRRAPLDACARARDAAIDVVHDHSAHRAAGTVRRGARHRPRALQRRPATRRCRERHPRPHRRAGRPRAAAAAGPRRRPTPPTGSSTSSAAGATSPGRPEGDAGSIASTWPDVAAVADRSLLVVPLGSTEQHGPHLPAVHRPAHRRGARRPPRRGADDVRGGPGGAVRRER